MPQRYHHPLLLLLLLFLDTHPVIGWSPPRSPFSTSSTFFASSSSRRRVERQRQTRLLHRLSLQSHPQGVNWICFRVKGHLPLLASHSSFIDRLSLSTEPVLFVGHDVIMTLPIQQTIH